MGEYRYTLTTEAEIILFDENEKLHKALDLLISDTTGKAINDPDIQRVKQDLINKAREEGGAL